MTKTETLIEELSVFADLGTAPPTAALSGADLVFRFIKDGGSTELTFINGRDGKVIERRENQYVTNHASYRALLASEGYGNLRKWADVQRDVLRLSLGDTAKLLEPDGRLASGEYIEGVEAVERILSNEKRVANDAAFILLVDGPAGIGKTKLIEQLCLMRASQYKFTQRPLILHVQSRGRVLSNLQDLMAFSLQSLRLSITYDQVPILVRHGLVTLAIDGFDELGDPNGYELAWAQVNDLVNFVRGDGILILAGRETFIGRERLFKDVQTLDPSRDVVSALTLQLPKPQKAIRWLREKGWTEEYFQSESMSALLEEGSYALRPFFLRLLADNELAARIKEQNAGYLLTFLVSHMIEREAGKFGEQVDRALTFEQRVRFVREFLCEVARDMADNQTEAIDESSLTWIVETVLGDSVAADIISLLKNRAIVMAFLTVDERPKFRRFIHSQLLNYFLSEVSIDAVGRAEVPKYLRRNIIGADLLADFTDIVTDVAGREPARITKFIENATSLSSSYINTDRGGRNLAAMLFGCLPVSHLTKNFTMRQLDLDEAVIHGTASAATIDMITINQLDARGADLQSLSFSDSTIVWLIADHGTLLGESFPTPHFVKDEGHASAGTITQPDEVKRWLDERSPSRKLDATSLISDKVREHEIFRLLGRACRLRQYWIRSFGDEIAEKVVENPYWEELSELLMSHDFMRMERNKPAKGKPSIFYHIKQPQRLLAEDTSDPQVVSFFRDLTSFVEQQSGSAA
jgi:hypothetical protein